MTTRWRRINALFDRALELAEADRAAFLEGACAGDPQLLLEVTRLLGAHLRASGFIEKPIDRALERIASVRETSLAGRQIGAWRVLREIGRGGMGTVFLGERADRQFDQHVAIKLIHPGMDTEWVLRRFRTERQILAGLEHANIARLYDGGTTEEGTPYFVMEFIEGVPIDRYCDERRLSVTKRLELFQQVCAALAFAHQRLVIHRDIKPSNVLVAGNGTAKLLDFGIAAILHNGDAGEAAHTATVQYLMTPEYASPEQVQGLRTTTLSDVYSLGVMLYELLCGRPPYRFASRSPADIARAMSDTPDRPSVAITSSRWLDGSSPRSAQDAEEISAAREGSVERLRRRLQGDLDTIVLKAMHADPQRRYASVDQFSEDIRRHLAGLPVIARPDTLAYRARKFVRRNRVPVGAAALAVLALLGGVVTTTWQARRAHEAQTSAERRFGDLRKLAHSVLFDYHDAVKDLAGSTPVRERLVADGLEYLDGLAREAGDDVSLQRELADAYLRMGDVQGGVAANLGKTAGAVQSYRKAKAIYASLIAADSTNTANRRGLAASLVKLSGMLLQTGDTQEALESGRGARLILESLTREAPSDSGARTQLASVLANEGFLLCETGAYAEAVDLHRRYLELCEAMAAADPANPSSRRTLSVANEFLSFSLTALGDYEEALGHNRATLRLRSDLAEEFPLNAEYRRTLYVTCFYGGDILTRLGRTREALENYERNLAIVEELLAADPKNEQYRSDRGHSLLRIGDTLVELDDLPRALTRYRAALAIRSAEADTDPENLFKRGALVEAHAKLGKALARHREYGAATKESNAALALLDAMPIDQFPAAARGAIGERYADLGAVYAIVAAGSRRDDQTARDPWQSALDMYRRSAAILKDLRDRGLLAEANADQLDAVNREIARCSLAAGP